MLAIANLAFAGAIAMQLGAPEIVAGQTVDLYVQVTDVSLAKPPTIPSAEGLRVEFDSRTAAREMINFQTHQIDTYRYKVTGLTAGEYDIGPLSLRAGPDPIAAPAVHLKVGERGSASATDELRAELGSDDIWVGQVVVVHMRVATDRQVVSARWGPPENPLLATEPGIEPVTAEFRIGQGAKPLTVEELWYPMRARKAGKSTLSGGSLLAQYAVKRKRGRSDFFNDLPMFADVENDTLVANPLPFAVKALPAAGRPENFSGLVGSFTLAAEASSTDVRVGDTVTVDVSLRGTGTLGGYTLPPWSGESFRVYDDTPVTSGKLADGALQAVASFKRAVVPAVAGQLTLPALEANWFDPATGSYVVSRLDPIVLNVTGSAAPAAVETFSASGGPEASTIPAEAEDILPVRTNVRLSAPHSGGWAWLTCLPGLAWLGGQALPLLRRKRARAEEAAFGFDDLPPDPEGRLAGLERIFREEAARRLGRPEPEVMREDVAPLGEEALALYRELDLARYRGGAAFPEARLRAWLGEKP
jgi:hypothetical protein